MDTLKGVLLQFAAFALIGLAVVGLTDMSWKARRYVTPIQCLRTYILSVLAVNEEGELGTATARLRAKAERERGPDKARRRRGLAGKAANFRASPIRFSEENQRYWGERARIIVIQGSAAGRPSYFTYSFLLENGSWKIDNIEAGMETDYK